jgi:tetratricopeptide (TPR) repeat protein
VGFFVLFAIINGCSFVLPQSEALRKQAPTDLPPQVELKNVPFYAQEDYQCGPAALAMVLNAAGANVTPASLVDQVYIPARKGSLQIEMLAATRTHGLLAYELAPQLSDVLHEISAGNPVIVLENYSYGLWPVWHYAVAIGYDLKEREIMRRSGTHRLEILPFSAFEYLWKTDGYWAMVALPLDQIPASASETRYANAVLALGKSGHTKNAQIAYGTLLKRWPKNIIGQMGLGNTSYILKDLEGAKAAFLKVTEDHPKAAEGFNNLANVLYDLGEIDNAILAAKAAVNLGGPFLEKSQSTLDKIKQQPKN